MNAQYEDILSLPHHRSTRRRQMPLSDRAAQFAPFAALTGFDDCIAEKSRLPETAQTRSEYALDILDQKLQQLMLLEKLHPVVTLVCFFPDSQNQVERYTQITGKLRRLDYTRQRLFLDSGAEIFRENIVDLQISPESNTESFDSA